MEKPLKFYFNYNWRLYILAVVLLLAAVVSVFIWRARYYAQLYVEGRIRDYLMKELNIEVVWDGLDWDILSSRLNILALRAEIDKTDGSNLLAYTGRLELYYSPLLLITSKTLDIKGIKIKGLKFSLRLPGIKPVEELRDLLQIVPMGKSREKGEWSLRLDRAVAYGKDLTIDLLNQNRYIAIRDFEVHVQDLEGEGPYPVKAVFNEGELRWRGLYRVFDSGRMKGRFDSKALHIDSLDFNITGEGRLSWSGDLNRHESGAYVDGRYSGELFCDTLAYFLKPFLEMKGKVSSQGSVTGPWKKMSVTAQVEAPEFQWRVYNFNDVKGRFTYHEKTLDFKDFEGIWRDGHFKAEAKVGLNDKKAQIGIHITRLPTVSLFKNWAGIFPIEPPLWAVDMDWGITWPEKIVKSQIELLMNAPIALSGKPSGQRLNIHTRFSSYRQLITFDNLGIVLGDNVINAEGDYDISKKELSLSYDCDLNERDTISRIWRIPLQGRGKIQGRMEGPLSGPGFSGNIQAYEVTLKDYFFDRLAMDYSYQEGKFNMENLEAGLKDAVLTGKGLLRLPVARGGLDLQLFWSVRDLPISELMKNIHYKPEFPYDGRLSGRGVLNIRGEKADIAGSFSGKGVTVYGQQAMDVEVAHFDAKEGGYAFKGVRLKRAKSVINGELSYDRGKGLLASAKGSLWELSQIRLLSDRRLPVKGVVDFDINGSLQDMTCQFKARGISYKDLGSWDIAGDIGLADGHLHASFSHPWGDGDLEVSLYGGLPFSIKAGFKGFPVFDPNIGLTDLNIEHSVILDGDLELSGLLKNGPGSVKGKFTGSRVKASSPFGRFENKGPYEVILKDGGLSISSLLMQCEKGSFEVRGSWHPQTGFDINTSGIVPLVEFSNRLSYLKGLSGYSEVSLNLQGKKRDPRLQGWIHIFEGGFSLPQYNFRVENIRGLIELTKESARIERLSADTRGGGWIELKGTIGYKGLELNAFDLVAYFENLYLYKRDAYRAYIEGGLEWKGGQDQSLLTGDLLLREARHTGYKNIIQLLLARKREVDSAKGMMFGIDPGKGWGNWLSKTELGIEFDLGDDFWVKSPFYNASITGDLQIKGTLNAPWLYGNIYVAEGDVFVGSQVFELTSGHISLPKPELSEPAINAVALKDLNGIRLRLSVFGPLRDPKFQFSSTPYMSQPEILNIVFFGLSTQEGGANRQESDILSLMLSTTSRVLDDVFGDKISYYTGLDMLKPDYLPKDLLKVDILDLGLEEKGGGVERLTLGKTLSRRLKIKYSRLTGEEEREVAEAEYIMTDHLTLIGAQDDQGTYSLDLNFGFRF